MRHTHCSGTSPGQLKYTPSAAAAAAAAAAADVDDVAVISLSLSNKRAVFAKSDEAGRGPRWHRVQDPARGDARRTWRMLGGGGDTSEVC